VIPSKWVYQATWTLFCCSLWVPLRYPLSNIPFSSSGREPYLLISRAYSQVVRAIGGIGSDDPKYFGSLEVVHKFSLNHAQ
jgi:hypothetical protein